MELPSLVDRRFRVLSIAGEGSFGTVYRASDMLTQHEVALKVLDRGRTDFARFEREAEVVATVKHPNVVAYVAHGLTDEGAPYLAMEWLEGVDLAVRQARGPFAIDEALAVAVRAAEGLGAAHALGIVHRDVKPSNLFLLRGRSDEVRVIDFGVARAPRSRLTSAATVLGTPAYMAPEQAQGDEVTARADVFALGCVLFECLVGASPFAAPDATRTMMKLLAGPAPRVGERRAGVSEAVDGLVARMLAREPAERFANGADVAAALRFLSG